MTSTPTILVVGSLNVDQTLRVPRLPAPGETLTARGATTCYGGKGANQAVAALEHPHIVQVYSETVDRSQNLRLVCMQYVDGTTLEAVIKRLKEIGPKPIAGRTVLEVISELTDGKVQLDCDRARSKTTASVANSSR